eukprot:5192470-Lingulodinium_polyedra.AAC.1
MATCDATTDADQNLDGAGAAEPNLTSERNGIVVVTWDRALATAPNAARKYVCRLVVDTANSDCRGPFIYSFIYSSSARRRE